MAKNQPAKRAPAKRARKTTKRVRQPLNQAPGGGDPNPHAVHEHPDMKWNDDGTIEWTMRNRRSGEVATYMLEPILMGDYFELERLRDHGGGERFIELANAMNLPYGTEEEQRAKLEQISAANEANNEWIWSWWEKLFAASERDSKTLNRALMPAWALNPKMMPTVLGHLAGPLPPGV